MLIARYLDGAVARLGVIEGDQIRPIDLGAPHGTEIVERLGVVALSTTGWRPTDRLRGATPRPLAEVRLLSPVPHPTKIIGIGVNYRDHATESAVALPSAPEVFAKFPNALQGPGGSINLSEADEAVDYEGELCVVIGVPARGLTIDTALSAVAGYTIANDVSARTWQSRVSQWVMGKSFDTFCPIGPWMATADAIEDPQSLTIETRLNGEVVQSAATREMVFSVVDILVFLSSVMTLEPGDLILTGTPAGVGHSRKPPRYLAPGDEVAITIKGIGTLTNPVRSGAEGSTARSRLSAVA